MALHIGAEFAVCRRENRAILHFCLRVCAAASTFSETVVSLRIRHGRKHQLATRWSTASAEHVSNLAEAR